MNIRNPYARVRVSEIVQGESLTEQSHAEGCDINNIVRRFHRTGSLPPSRAEGFYADCTTLSGPLSERIEWAENIITEYKAALATQNDAEGVSNAPQGAITPPPSTTPQGTSL